MQYAEWTSPWEDVVTTFIVSVLPTYNTEYLRSARPIFNFISHLLKLQWIDFLSNFSLPRRLMIAWNTTLLTFQNGHNPLKNRRTPGKGPPCSRRQCSRVRIFDMGPINYGVGACNNTKTLFRRTRICRVARTPRLGRGQLYVPIHFVPPASGWKTFGVTSPPIRTYRNPIGCLPMIALEITFSHADCVRDNLAVKLRLVSNVELYTSVY